MRATLGSAWIVGLFALVGCGGNVMPMDGASDGGDIAPSIDAQDVSDASMPIDAADVADAAPCPTFPRASAVVLNAPDAGSTSTTIAEGARACAMAGACFGVDQRTCPEFYLEAVAGSVSVAHIARLGGLVGSLVDNPELAAALLANAHTCIAGATSCDAVASCLGAVPSTVAFMPGDTSACAGSSLLVRATTTGCGPERVIPIDCAATAGLMCVPSAPGQAVCGDGPCVAAGGNTTTCGLSSYTECVGTAQVSGDCAERPWLQTPACWIDADDHDVQCGSGTVATEAACTAIGMSCASDTLLSCEVHGDVAVGGNGNILDNQQCAMRAPGLHCGAVAGSPGAFACVAASDCTPETVSCAGAIASVCVFGANVTVDCGALGGTCTAQGCAGP